ncbi:GTP pyrophosphokinase [Filomicrobium insigne]|uniref:GTP pyrophosphokinase rsh n=1 Tax=Filomicrobium insigne TaxID=418854 RepID=A0A1H0R1Y7_9HYPH|nr:bifunctional (p)ppGpp synthetase/guanosine-3',5'-bis(diphosphate) 3'-pyrophosphohydrolase [Filomicrobium insigne]SDP23497.1 GTP pyrophosphokinase [Filomicrobium insigne]
MMRQYELVERVTKYDPGADEVLLNRAYVYAMKAHGHQKRASGDPYFSHPLEVAAILTDLHLDSATITTALLHDVIEDTDATRAEIDQLFGAEIGALVDGLTKIKRLDLVSKQAEQAENFRKLLIAISSDIRVLLVKLADRLHNMRTLEYMKPASRQRISEETLEVYAPLAGRMGMQAMREELEDLSFRWLYPEAYETVVHKLVDIHEKNEGLVEEIRIALEAKLSDVGIQAAVHGREKKPYSIWRKMQNKQIGLEQLSDIYGFRIIVENIADCYRVLGVAHTTWRTVPGRFKDYISTPKQNGYQSIHTTIVGPRHQRVELQIRTKEMHDVAEYGVAAHTFYKEPTNGASGNGSSTVLNPDSGPYHWLRRLVDTLLEGSNPVEFLEHTKLELFQDQVFCFSPKGRLIALPHGATPLDFAYAVHTDIGNAAVGAYINGRHMPIDTQLRNGDEVEILTSKTHTPPAAWEHFAVTGRARSAIRRAARDTMRRQYTELGRRLVTSALQAQSESYSDDRLKGALPRIAGGKTVEDVLAGVARNEIAVDEVVRAILPDANLPALAKSPRAKARRHQPSNQEGWFNLSKVMGLKFRVGQEIEEGMSLPGSIPLRGLKSDIPVTFEDGGAVPGDRIVGVLTPGEGIRIFQIHSPRLKAYEHERWIDVTWDINRDQPERFPARIAVTALNEPGTLAQIAHVIGEASGNIDQVRMVGRGPDFTKMLIEVEVWDLEHLNMILSGLKSQSVVSHADRVFD